ncbi:MAG: hypothetical protein JWO95_3133 [Verrucomicrobiales bacterium]|nr:hypothetical protein [Verrucomicrobiales bacterium]
MKTTYQTRTTASKTSQFTKICVTACKKLLARIEEAKENVIAEFSANLKGREHMLQLAVNEAEAIAWQTEFPYLVFPTLAREKAASVENWAAHQRQVRNGAQRALLTHD